MAGCGAGNNIGTEGLRRGWWEGPLLGESASLGSWGQAQQEGRLAGAGDTWWPWPAAGGRVLGVRGSARSLPIYRMEELGLHPADRQVYFGQLLGMCDQISFPLGEGPPRGGAGAGLGSGGRAGPPGTGL